MTEEAAAPEVKEAAPVVAGAFLDSLKRNNKKIREDRAEQISEDAQMKYKRTVEDLEIEIRQMNREQEMMLDLSPDTATSLIVASDFDGSAYVQKDLELGVKIRNAKIKLDIAARRYQYLFGGK